LLETITARAVLRTATVRLRDAGCETPRLDAELLLACAMGVERARLLIDDHAVPVAEFEALLARREAHEPVAYIVGYKDFRHIRLSVDRRVLIPRPETELLVEAALTLPAGARVADVGTGSGAVALALKDERPDLEVTGIDVSVDALKLARENATRLGLEVRFVHADLLDGAEYDAVLANLPYVAAGAELGPEIVLYEPTEALFAGPEGLDVIKRLIARLGNAPFVALEIGLDQAEPVTALLQHTGFRSIELLRDLAGHERVVAGRR
jgi:release factor glutamine methyltransferase